MKFTLKLLLFLCILIAGIYVATPLWLPSILARQLPPGWQLEKLEVAYPGLSGMDIRLLRVKGAFQEAGVTFAAADLRFTYRDLKIQTDSISIDVYMRTAKDSFVNPVILNSLFQAAGKQSGKMPELSDKQLRMTIHHATDPASGNIESTRSLLLGLKMLEISPHTNNSIHLSGHVSFEASPWATGLVDIDIGKSLLNGEIRFPADINSPAWLIIQAEQQNRQSVNSVTRIQAVLDAAFSDREWFDSIIRSGSGGLLTHVSGKCDIQARFTGENMQSMEHLSVNTRKLLLESEYGVLILKTDLQANREDKKVIVKLPAATNLEYRHKTGGIDRLITSVFPGFQRMPRTEISAFAELGSNSIFEILSDANPSISFDGDINFDLRSNGEVLSLHGDDLQVEMAGISKLPSIAADDLIKLEWKENTPFTYTSPELELKADKLSVAAELTSRDGKTFSTGRAVLENTRIEPYAVSTTGIDMNWQEFDLLNMTGSLNTRTQEFAIRLEGETWTGFDFDVSYSLPGESKVDGSGLLKINKGPQIPFRFSGDTETEKWLVNVPSITFSPRQLDSLMNVAHLEMPDSVKLNDGSIIVQADVIVDDEITAKMAIKGRELSASMFENAIQNASFSFNSTFDQTLSASGPVSIEAIALAAGMDMTGFKANLKLENTETFGLQNLYAGLFGGQMRLGNLRFSEKRIEDTTAELSHIKLDRLLAFADVDGLHGTGSLEISLPLGSDQEGIYIKNGVFRSTGPGLLAYKNNIAAASNIGMQALEKFQYQDLSGTIDYQSDGTYQIEVHLEGRNPDLYGGYPVNFNLNIGGSLPALFEALFMTGDFEEAILNEIRNQ